MVNKLILLFLIASLFSCKKEAPIKQEEKSIVTVKKYNLPIVDCSIKSLIKDSTVSHNYKKEIGFIKQFFKTNFSQRFSGQFLVVKDNCILYDTLKMLFRL